MADYRPGTPEQAAFLAELIDRRLLLQTASQAYTGAAQTSRTVFQRVSQLVTRAGAGEQPEQMRFPPCSRATTSRPSATSRAFPTSPAASSPSTAVKARPASSTSAPASTRTGASSSR